MSGMARGSEFVCHSCGKFRFRFGACEPMRIHLLKSIKLLFLGRKH